MNSLSTILENFIRLQNDAFNLLQGLNQSLLSDNESININYSNQTIQIPSFGFLKRELTSIKNRINDLTGQTGEILNPDGTFRPILRSKPLINPQPIGVLNPPTQFFTESNWFFEDLLVPSLNVKFDVSKWVTQDQSKIFWRRIIIKSDAQNQIVKDLIGKNDLDYVQTIKFLESNLIQYQIDDNYKDLPLGIIRYSGVFKPLKIEIRTDSNGNNSAWYRLDTQNYNDNLSTVKNGEKLKIGDLLSFKNSTWRIDEIDNQFYRLVIINGDDYPSIGDELQYVSKIVSQKTVNVSVQPNEINILFFKTIDDDNNIISTIYSPGVCFNTNDLIDIQSGQTMDVYYKQNVLDLGRYFLGMAKETPITNIDALKPNSPVLSEENFKVVLINQHKINQDQIQSINAKQSDKIRIESEIRQLTTAIKEKTIALNATNFNSETEKRAVKNQLDELIRKRTIKSNEYSTIIDELNILATQRPAALDTPKYRIRGFFEIPSPQIGETGPQHIIMFKVYWRYITPGGENINTQQLVFTDSNGNNRRANFSNWQEWTSNLRKKIWDPQKMVYIWQDEDLENPDAININQVDIPITKGESVEFYVVSVSEAGFPLNPAVSDPSNVITITFPENLSTDNTASTSLEQSREERILLKLQNDLTSKGLEEHLSDSFNNLDKYYSHTSESISSGFFTPEGNVISLFEKIKELQTRILDLENRLNKVLAPVKLFIIDEASNSKIEVKNGDTINLFAGYYRDELLKIPPASRRGAIINKIWKLQIINDQASPLQLVSRFPGGLSSVLPDSNNINLNDQDYKDYRKYDKTPIVNTSISNRDTNNSNRISTAFYQSGQLKGQFIYSRYTDIGLVTPLYDSPNTLSARKLIPINPISGPTQPWVWDQNPIGIGNNPIGNGRLSEFCIHIQHPKLNNTQIARSMPILMTPDIQLDNLNRPISDESVPAFLHSWNFNQQGTLNSPVKQLSYSPNWEINPTPPVGPGTVTPSLDWLPDKFGFVDDDRYLIGKNTCGAYLYVAPAQIESILVDGVDARARKELPPGETNSIIIPIIFQYRMTDYFGPSIIDDNTLGGDGIVGGYDPLSSVPPKNLSYVRKIGLDITQLDLSMISFDIQVSATYQKDSTVQVLDPGIPTKISTTKNIINRKSDIKKIF